jgi:serine protease Do
MKFVLNSLIKYGEVKRGYLGVLISNIDSSKAKLYGVDHGVLINKVEPNSAASKAGLKVGDIIVAVDGEKVNNAGELRNKIAFKGPGADVKLAVYRNGKYLTLTAKLKALKTKIQKIDSTILEGITLKEDKNSVIIDSIEPNSYAALAGLQKGDKIVRIRTIKTGKWINVTSIEKLKKLLKGLDKGDALIEVERKNQLFIIQL